MSKNKKLSNNISEEIERISMKELEIKNFEKNFLLKSQPVIITDVFNTSPDLALWTPGYLAKKIKNKVVRVNRSNDGRFGLDPVKGGFVSDPVYMPFSEFVDGLKEATRKLYIGQVSILKELVELKDEIEIPKYIKSDDIRMNLWFGPGGNTSPLHYDGMNNFFIQVYGTKQILLSNPFEFRNLYPYPWYSKAPHSSRINVDNLDTAIYPRATKAKFIKITIHPGEMLFIPVYWWHQVYGKDVTISINIWWKGIFKQHFTPGAIQNLLHYAFYAFKKLILLKR